VSGPNRDYLWLLSRTPDIPSHIRQQYLALAAELGFAVNKLVWVPQAKA
ncbi:lipocalin family protein, partial [Klebsiella aerogenes]